MKIDYHKKFYKTFDKLPIKIQEKFYERLRIFSQNQFNTVLNNHALTGEYRGYRSIDITGDLRAIFELIEKDTSLFIMVDTHSNLYK